MIISRTASFASVLRVCGPTVDPEAGGGLYTASTLAYDRHLVKRSEQLLFNLCSLYTTVVKHPFVRWDHLDLERPKTKAAARLCLLLWKICLYQNP